LDARRYAIGISLGLVKLEQEAPVIILEEFRMLFGRSSGSNNTTNHHLLLHHHYDKAEKESEEKGQFGKPTIRKSQSDWLTKGREYNLNECFNPCSPGLVFQIC
jgi:hypothetical protein